MQFPPDLPDPPDRVARLDVVRLYAHEAGWDPAQAILAIAIFMHPTTMRGGHIFDEVDR